MTYCKGYKRHIFLLFNVVYFCPQKSNLLWYMKGQFIATLTVEEFIGVLEDSGYSIIKKEPAARQAEAPGVEVLDFSDSTRYGQGLAAIESRYNVSHLTAQRLKKGALAPAIYQTGPRGKIYVDYRKADEILNGHKWKKQKENSPADIIPGEHEKEVAL